MGRIVIARGLSTHLFDSFSISRGTCDCYKNSIQYPTPGQKKKRKTKSNNISRIFLRTSIDSYCSNFMTPSNFPLLNYS